MSHPASLPGEWPALACDASRQVADLAERARKIVAIAQAMFDNGRPVDLTGLQGSVGLLCAKALDLPPDDAPKARAELVRLTTSLDALSLAMREACE